MVPKFGHHLRGMITNILRSPSSREREGIVPSETEHKETGVIRNQCRLLGICYFCETKRYYSLKIVVLELDFSSQREVQVTYKCLQFSCGSLGDSFAFQMTFIQQT